jgi:hypothetical protein
MKPPNTHKELKSFLGKLSYIRRFILGFTVVTSTFAPLLKKGAPFHWSTECQLAFEKVQDIITKLPTVCAPIFRKPLRLYLASNSQAIRALMMVVGLNNPSIMLVVLSRMPKADTRGLSKSKAYERIIFSKS